MSECKREDISERIIMALHPEDFPAQAEEIRAHVTECGSCMDELKSLTSLTAFLREHKAELACAVNPCPSAESLVEFAMGERIDPSIESHVHYCSDCAEQVEHVRSLSAEDLPATASEPGRKEESYISCTIESVYPKARAERAGIGRRISDFFKTAFHVPSMAMGAAVSVAIAAILWIHPLVGETLRPVYSDAVWQTEPAHSPKNGLVPKKAAVPTAKVALLILASGEDSQPQRDMIDELYAKVNIAEKAHSKYQFVSPREMKQALGAVTETKDLTSLAGEVFGKTKADYVLMFTVSVSRKRYKHGGPSWSLEAKLFGHGGKRSLYSTTQSVILPARLPSRITALGVDLLNEAQSLHEDSMRTH